jgi:hypothetical protein
LIFGETEGNDGWAGNHDRASFGRRRQVFPSEERK